jgi:hypothetical protein
LSTHIAQLNHGVASLLVPSPSPLPGPPMFRTPSTNSHLADEEGRLKILMDE